MQAKTKIWFGILTVVAVLASLITMGMSNATAFYMTVDEVIAKQSKAVDKPLKVSGFIVGESVRWDAEKLLLTFQLEGESGKRMKFEYAGVKPDTFNDEWEAIVDGKLQENGVFVATELLVKCPSKYEALEEAGETLPADHQEAGKP